MQYVSAFPNRRPASDNAAMHFIKDYTTPAALALANLCAKKKRGNTHYLLKQEDDGTWRVNANALSREMETEGIKLPQSTITRLLHGQPSRPETIQALVDFFQVEPAVIRGEVVLFENKVKTSGGIRWPFEKEVSFEDFDGLEEGQKHLIAVTVRGLVATYQAENGPRRRKKINEA
jgi:hypothetical protein